MYNFRFFNSHRAALTEIITHYNKIVRFVTVVYEEFEKYIHYVRILFHTFFLPIYYMTINCVVIKII